MNFTLLRQNKFRNFFFADIISGFGVGMATVGANWYVLQQTHSDSIVGMFLAINVLAGFLISPIAGWITDKFMRRNVIIATFAFRAIPIALIALWLYLFKFNLIAMYLLAIVTGAGWVAYMSSSRSYVQAIVPDNLLGMANSFIEISLQVGMFLAGAASGVVINYVGFIPILILNVILFSIAIILMFTSPVDHQTIAKTENNVKENSVFRYVLEHKLILILGLISILPLIVTQLFNVSMPGYVSNILNDNSIAYGITDMCYGIGGLVAGLLSAWLLNKFNKQHLLIAFFTIASIALFSLFILKSTLLTYSFAFLIGLSNSSLRVTINTILMRVVKKSYMGRTTSMWTGGAQFIEIFSSTFIGRLNDVWGSNYGFLCMFIIMVIGLVSSLFVKE